MNDSNSILYMLIHIHHMHFTVFVRIKEIVKSITNEHFSSNVVLAFVMQSKSSKNMHVRRNWDEKKNKIRGKDSHAKRMSVHCAAVFSVVDDTSQKQKQHWKNTSGQQV